MNILSKYQWEKFNNWKNSFGELPNIGLIGGHFTIEIMFTSIGEVIKAKSWNGKELDLTEYENF